VGVKKYQKCGQKELEFLLFPDGERKDTQNYRGITLLSIVGKVYTFVLNKVERLVREKQNCG
jgi:hypothetical protein